MVTYDKTEVIDTVIDLVVGFCLHMQEHLISSQNETTLKEKSFILGEDQTRWVNASPYTNILPRFFTALAKRMENEHTEKTAERNTSVTCGLPSPERTHEFHVIVSPVDCEGLWSLLPWWDGLQRGVCTEQHKWNGRWGRLRCQSQATFVSGINGFRACKTLSRFDWVTALKKNASYLCL